MIVTGKVHYRSTEVVFKGTGTKRVEHTANGFNLDNDRNAVSARPNWVSPQARRSLNQEAKGFKPLVTHFCDGSSTSPAISSSTYGIISGRAWRLWLIRVSA